MLGLDVIIRPRETATTGRDALAEFEAAIRDRAEVMELLRLPANGIFVEDRHQEHQGLRGLLSRLFSRTLVCRLIGGHRHQGIDRTAARNLMLAQGRAQLNAVVFGEELGDPVDERADLAR